MCVSVYPTLTLREGWACVVFFFILLAELERGLIDCLLHTYAQTDNEV